MMNRGDPVGGKEHTLKAEYRISLGYPMGKSLRLFTKGTRMRLDFLITKYRSFVRLKARSYFLIGGDREDIIQEGMIGLYKAIRDFKEDRLSSFKAFAELCITRQIITAIKTATRQKHIPLNTSVSLDKPFSTKIPTARCWM